MRWLKRLPVFQPVSHAHQHTWLCCAPFTTSLNETTVAKVNGKDWQLHFTRKKSFTGAACSQTYPGLGLPRPLGGKDRPPMQEMWVRSLGREGPLEKELLPTLGFLPGKSHGQRSRAGCSPWGRKESDTTEWVNNDMANSLGDTCHCKDGLWPVVPKRRGVQCLNGPRGATWGGTGIAHKQGK